MTSGRPNNAPPRRRRGGFTLLEIMLVLMLIALIFVGAAPLVSTSMHERQLRASADQIADIIRDQRADARNDGHRRLVEIRSGGFYEKGSDKQIASLPGNAIFHVRMPGGDWEKPDRQLVEFSSIGMVTPISVRLETGDAWIELDFDLLTGRIGEERYAF